ncbi:MAG: ABC transporter permease [Armatimonadetes bacterium CG07_land_8_20_14_0_80_40_9]|nr:MAG: ABC transporter permease [Armatimonadetes bacterium CG07_land_8_20_14_0_80_40_9]
MDYIYEGLKNALKIIISLDPEMLGIVFVSLKVSTTSIVLATLVGVPLGFYIAIKDFWGKGGIVLLLNTLMALPTVIIGLLVYSFISRGGPLGSLGFLYTPWAMIIGQFILALPIVSNLSLSATQGVDKRVEKTALTLGADNLQTALTILREGRFAIFAAIIAGFGRVFSEVGISMMLGGNIKWLTRNITTAIAFETGKGEFSLGLSLGIILLTVAFSINILFSYLQKKGA